MCWLSVRDEQKKQKAGKQCVRLTESEHECVYFVNFSEVWCGAHVVEDYIADDGDSDHVAFPSPRQLSNDSPVHVFASTHEEKSSDESNKKYQPYRSQYHEENQRIAQAFHKGAL